MKSCPVVLSCFFIVFVFSVSHFGTASGQYNPVYFIETETDYELIYNVEQDATKEHYVVKAPNKNILIACPSPNTDSNLIEVRKIERNEVTVVPFCEKPNESSVLNIKSVDKDGEEFGVIGYQFPSNKHFNIIDLMNFKYDDANNRIKTVWHNIGAGKLLTPEIGPKSDEPYQTNENIYGFDVNPLYRNSATYAKVQLAPEEDFLFDHMKSGSRQDILTAPMRRDLLPQWRELEISIRKVARVIDAVFVITGIHETILQTGDMESLQEPVHLNGGIYPIPRLFWKAVAVDFEHNNIRYRNGIIFVLHNVEPSSDSVPKKICSDDLSKTGWRFPSNNEFKHFMYACLWTKENMKALGDDSYFVDHKVFDLNRVPTIRIDETGKEIFEEIDVIRRIDGTLYTMMRYFVNAFTLPFQYISSYYYNYNKNK